MLGILSILIGLFFGVLSSLIFKHLRFFTHSAVTETCVLFIFAFLTYFVSEILEQSGMISLLTCGITMAHYTWYNLSPQGKTVTSITFTTLGAAAEAFVFAYIGLCVFTYVNSSNESHHVWSVSFIGWMVIIVVLGRIVGVWLAHGICKICIRKDISLRELCFISWGGMIRGAIAFGLVLKIEEDKVSEREVIITTTLALVIITTLFFGTFMKFAQKIMIPPPASPAEDNKIEEIAAILQAQHEQFEFAGDENNDPIQHIKVNSSQEMGAKDPQNDSKPDIHDTRGSDAHSHYGELVHPNMEKDRESVINVDEMRNYDKRKKKNCKYYFSKLDYEVLRPLLIYKYEKETMHLQDDIYELLQSKQNVLGSIYQQMDNTELESIMRSTGRQSVQQNEIDTRRISLVVQHLAMQKGQQKYAKSAMIPR